MVSISSVFSSIPSIGKNNIKLGEVPKYTPSYKLDEKNAVVPKTLSPEELAAKLEREKLQAESTRIINEKKAEQDRLIALNTANAKIATEKELAMKQLEYQQQNQSQQLQYEAQAEADSKIFGLDLSTVLMLGGAGVAILMVMKK